MLNSTTYTEKRALVPTKVETADGEETKTIWLKKYLVVTKCVNGKKTIRKIEL